MTIFDANVWVAFLYAEDSQHAKALEVFARIHEPVIVSEYIAAEVCTVLSQRVGIALAQKFLRDLVSRDHARVLYSSPELFLRTVELFGTFTHKRFSFTDAMLLVLSKSYSVVTFDVALKKAMR